MKADDRSHRRGPQMTIWSASMSFSAPTPTDASILALAERKLTTRDHRHFATMRPRHAKALDLLPA